jgi:hypothetical protein
VLLAGCLRRDFDLDESTVQLTTTLIRTQFKTQYQDLDVLSRLRTTIMAEQVNWQRQLTFSDRLSVISKMQANAREATTVRRIGTD